MCWGSCPQVRITSVNKVRNYISYAVALLEEKGHSSVILKAMGQAINKAVVVGASPTTQQLSVCSSAPCAEPSLSAGREGDTHPSDTVAPGKASPVC